MEGDLICNFKKCRQRLNGCAWVTSCSHIFCDKDGSREFNKNLQCPACSCPLNRKYDIVRIDMQPSEEYKSMVLAGQSPDVIMEICSRSLTFWNHQCQEERSYQEYIMNSSKEKLIQTQRCYEQLIDRTKTEIDNLQSQLSSIQLECEDVKKKYHEVCEKFMEKTRQNHKMQTMYDSLRRKCISQKYREDGGEGIGGGSSGGTPQYSKSRFNDNDMSSPFDLKLKSGTSIFQRNQNKERSEIGSKSGSEDDFRLRFNNGPFPSSNHQMGPKIDFTRLKRN